jgi:hypothetical protein
MSLRCEHGGWNGAVARRLTLGFALGLLAACGGDGGGGSTTAPDAEGFGGETGGESGGGSGGQGGDPTGGTTGGGGGTAGSGGTGGVGGTPVGGRDGGLEPDRPCTCERALVCDPRGDCVEQTPCETDLHCLAGRICQEGACVDGCADDAACAGEGLDNRCFDGRCRQCETDGDCFGRSTCDAETFRCLEPDECDDSRECISPNICNIRTRRCSAPFDCRAAGSTCNEGLVCEPETGRCAAPAACTENANCPVGQVCAPGRNRTCRPCGADDECDGAQVCRAGACTEVDCESEADCLGNRACVAGTCVAPACEDDAGEDHDTLATAEVLGGGGAFDAQSCAGDDDYYRFTLPRSTAGTVTLRADGLGAELDVEILDADGALVAAGDAAGLVEVVVVGPFVIDRDLVVRVFQRGAQGSAGYTFDLGLEPVMAGACVDDAVDASGNDDDLANARSLRPAGTPTIDRTITGRSCPGDADWMCVQLGDGENLDIQGRVTAGDLVLDAELVNGGDESVVGSTQWARGQDGGPLGRSVRGVYCLALRPASGTGSYEVRIVVTNARVGAFCEEATPLALNAAGAAQVSGSLPTAAADDILTASCASANVDGGDVVYSLHLDEPRLVVARVTGEAGGTLGDPHVSIRTDCASAPSEVACNDDRFEPDAPYLVEANPAEVRVPVERAGDIAILIDGTAPGERPEYRLDVTTLPLAAPPANDGCGNAAALELQDGLGRIRVNLDRAADDVGAGCLPSSGPDAIYRLQIDAPSRVSAQVFADFAVGVSLAAACGPADALGCGTGFDLSNVPAGEYFLIVEGVGPQARGRVQGQVLVEPIAPAPANDACGAAQNLDRAGGVLQANTAGANDDAQLPDGNQCTGHATIGSGDVVYRLTLEPRRTYFVEAVPERGWDLSLFVVDDCAMPNATCRVGHDGALTERVEFAGGAAEETVTIIVDGANGESGPFELRWGPLDAPQP